MPGITDERNAPESALPAAPDGLAPLPEPAPAAAPPAADDPLATLQEAARTQDELLTVTADFRLAAESILRAAQHLVGARRSFLAWPEEGELQPLFGHGYRDDATPSVDALAHARRAWDAGRSDWRRMEGKTWAVALTVSFPPKHTAAFIPERRRVSIARIPYGERMGTIVLEGIEAEEADLAPLNARMGLFAQRLSPVLLNARWLFLATTDRLTGLLTRDRFDAALADLLEQAQAEKLPVSVLLIDISGLREINTAFGHARGDGLIRDVARQLKRLSRRSDVPARYGGDEFAIALPNTDTAEALQVADRIRRTAPSIPTHGEARRDRPTDKCVLTRLAIGIATFPNCGRTWEEMFKAADEALYASKRGGRDRTTIWEPRMRDHAAA